VVDTVRPAEGLKEVRDLQHALLDRCLAEHGYRRFRLTDEQRAHFEKLKTGSDARHACLHQLASDPAILSAQTASDPPIAKLP